jgi:hypothetical protein
MVHAQQFNTHVKVIPEHQSQNKQWTLGKNSQNILNLNQNAIKIFGGMKMREKVA